jgi:hypothetical protein
VHSSFYNAQIVNIDKDAGLQLEIIKKLLHSNLTYGMSIFGRSLVLTDEKLFNHENNMINKTELLEIIKKLLKTNADLDFLLNLQESDLETLVVCIRERFDQLGKQTL